MEVQYYGSTVARYFIIVDGIYELSTDDLDLAIRIIKDSPIDDIQLLDTHVRKWIDVEKLFK